MNAIFFLLSMRYMLSDYVGSAGNGRHVLFCFGEHLSHGATER